MDKFAGHLIEAKKVIAAAVFLILLNAHIASAGSGFEPAISGIIDDVVNKTVSKKTVDSASDRISKFSDVYGEARKIPDNIKEAIGTKTVEVKPKKKGLTFWQKIDRLIKKQRNSNY